MNIQCENCASHHDLDPPEWVIASGRPFRFRCSNCGHSQMANPPSSLEMTPQSLAQAATPKPAQPRTSPLRPVQAPSSDQSDSVFLKQEGKVYLVRNWATLQRWIMENRVDRDDQVSEGGVKWETVGSRPELGSFFAAIEKLEAAELAGIGVEKPTEPEAPMSLETGVFARLDDPTEGIPVGLPPLPTEEFFMESDPVAVEENNYPEVPPSRDPVESALEEEDFSFPATPELASESTDSTEASGSAMALEFEPRMESLDAGSLTDNVDSPDLLDADSPLPGALAFDENIATKYVLEDIQHLFKVNPL